MFLNIPFQSNESEWMDREDCLLEDLRKSLNDLKWVNRYLGGTSVVIRNLSGLIEGSKISRISILDVATGSGDIPIRLVEWARKSGLEISILAIDKNPRIIEIAKEYGQRYPEITFEVQDFYNITQSEKSFDYCMSSLFLHHIGSEQVILFLKKMLYLCRQAVIINDLVRGWAPYYLFKLLAGVTGFHPMTRHDGAVSVLRSYTIAEMQEIVLPHFSSFKIQKHFPYRFSLVLEKDCA